MKNLSLRKNDWGLGLFDGFDSFFRPWLLEDYQMKTDIKDAGDNYQLEIELPGFDKKDISLLLEDGYLKVAATKEEEKKDDKYLRKERKFGSVKRTFYVGELSEDDVKASYNNGVLSVVFPKEAPPKLEEQKRIPIE
ncbi:MAG: Hsp20/alpha crystallin family protein [Clostridia bacterium]